MYKLTKLDEFNIKSLLGLKRNGLNDEDLNQGIDYFLSMDNETLGYTINKILHNWESEYFFGITGKQKKLRIWIACKGGTAEIIEWITGNRGKKTGEKFGKK